MDEETKEVVQTQIRCADCKRIFPITKLSNFQGNGQDEEERGPAEGTEHLICSECYQRRMYE